MAFHGKGFEISKSGDFYGAYRCVLGEFVLCFIRGYEELWYTIAIPSVIVTVLALFAFKTRCKWLFFVGTAIVSGGAVLLIGFPAYVMYLALISGGFSLAAEAAMLAFGLQAGMRVADVGCISACRTADGRFAPAFTARVSGKLLYRSV